MASILSRFIKPIISTVTTITNHAHLYEFKNIFLKLIVTINTYVANTLYPSKILYLICSPFNIWRYMNNTRTIQHSLLLLHSKHSFDFVSVSISSKVINKSFLWFIRWRITCSTASCVQLAVNMGVAQGGILQLSLQFL